jgi:pimeloyl-ACP methyl ester carboxylesterase
VVGAREPEGLASWGAHPISDRDLAWSGGRARLYAPADDDDPPGVVLIHGVHARGIDEPRLRVFAQSMASAGLAVMTPEIVELTEYRLEPGTIDRIGDAARALARDLGSERVGVIGVSFSGGLSLMAAARDAGGGAIGWVLSVGGHHDLMRVARFYAGERVEGPNGEHLATAPHPYGAGVLVYRHVEELFPAEDVPEARAIVRELLHDRWREAHARADDLATDAGRARIRSVLDVDDPGRDALARDLLAVLERHRRSLDLASPRGALARLDTPVFLLHGADDPVVPATETLWLAHDVPPAALERTLVTDAIRHAEYGREPTFAERWDLVRFMASVLATARATAR